MEDALRPLLQDQPIELGNVVHVDERDAIATVTDIDGRALVDRAREVTAENAPTVPIHKAGTDH